MTPFLCATPHTLVVNCARAFPPPAPRHPHPHLGIARRPSLVSQPRLCVFFHVAGQRLVKLTDSALKDGLGIASLGHRMSLLEAIQGLGKAAAFPTLSASCSPAGGRPKPRVSVVANSITVAVQVWVRQKPCRLTTARASKHTGGVDCGRLSVMCCTLTHPFSARVSVAYHLRPVPSRACLLITGKVCRWRHVGNQGGARSR